MNGFKRFWADAWLSEARGASSPFWTLPLRLLEPVVRGVIRKRSNEFDQDPARARSSLPVVSVGNLTVGGTNKTPTVDWILRRLSPHGRALGVVTRGYGRSGPPRTFRGVDSRGDELDLGDEPALLAAHHPNVWIAIDPDRVRGVASLESRGVEWVVADDAFQHRRLARAFDLVLVDASCPWGSGRLLPAGILREPPSALSRASAVLLTRADEADEADLERLRNELEEWVPRDRIHPARLEVSGWLRLGSTADVRSAPSGEAAFVLTGIARPESLVRTARAESLEVVGWSTFRDHAKIGSEPFRRVVAEALQKGAALLVCSEKDLPNLPRDAADSSPLPIWVPRVEMSIDRGDELLARIATALSS